MFNFPIYGIVRVDQLLSIINPLMQAQFEFGLAAVVEETHAMLDAASQRQRH